MLTACGNYFTSSFECRDRPAGAVMLTGCRFQAAKTLRPLTRAITCRASTFYTDPSKNQEPEASTSPDISPEQRKILDNALRVDQAGEIAANWIYRGQMTVLGRDPRMGPLIQEMWDQEKRHLAVMDKLQLQHQVRPTILSDVAKAVGFALGATTALMGKEAAMACTEAVETVIGEHYDEFVLIILGAMP
ncbi:hypothetical protein AZE42_09380 [Rhizopogon vesiculosus]|uniref:Uncharacterized protein n=1 Tax=Rhizopogon vesiculosus TaxID=180088 RepID=A0A1J8Q2N6_9AGAM|nr:hypothetical protein AZE42_09380 [Rhizopogon vesiculosus]